MKDTKTFSSVLRVLKRRIFIHIGIKTEASSQPDSDCDVLIDVMRKGNHPKLVVKRDSTFVLLCKGSCTVSGQTGILFDQEAEDFLEKMKQRNCGDVWVITPQDLVIKGLPTKTEKHSALSILGPATPRGAVVPLETAAYIVSHCDVTAHDSSASCYHRPSADEQYGVETYNPSSLTDFDTFGGGDSLATFPHVSVPKGQLPFMKDWEDRQATSRSTGKRRPSLSLFIIQI